MRPPTINDRKLVQLIDVEKLNQAAAARKLGVTRSAVSKRLQELRGRTTKAVVAKRLNQVVDKKLDAMAQIQKINVHANELLDLCMAWQRGDDVAIQILESQGTSKTIRIGNEKIEIKDFKFKDPRELSLKAMAEIRGQIKLQMDLFETLYSVQAAQEFQQEVLTAIGEADADTRKRIIDRLNQKRAIRSAVSFS